MQLPAFDMHPHMGALPPLNEIPSGDVNDYPDWPDIIDACEGLSYDEPFEVYELSDSWKHYPAGTLTVIARDRVYLRPVPTTGIVVQFPAGKVKYTASGTGCKQCGLCEHRSMIVDGVGPFNPKLMIVGEAPGRQEDSSGIPFVGDSGDYLKARLGELGLTVDDYYLTNVVRCRPPGNRAPTVKEIDACRFWLEQEIERVNPRGILLLGATAREYAPRAFDPQRNYKAEQLAHPAAIIRNTGGKREREWITELGRVCERLGATAPGVLEHVAGPDGWAHGEPDWDADVIAIDTETRSLEDDYGSDLVTVQASDGRRAELYQPVHPVAGQGGPVRLRRIAGAWEVAEGAPGSLQTKVGPLSPGGRLAHLSQYQVPQLAAHPGRDASGESGPVTGIEWENREQELPARRYVFHNVKYDAPRIGLDLRDLDSWEDTALMAYQLRYERVGLKQLGPELTGLAMTPISDLLKIRTAVTKKVVYGGVSPRHDETSGNRWLCTYPAKLMPDGKRFHHRYESKEAATAVWEQLQIDYPGPEKITEHWEKIDFEQALYRKPGEAIEYALLDAVVTARMFPLLYRKLAAEPRLLKHYYEMEKPVVPIVYDMEQNGARIDNDALAKLEAQIAEAAETHKAVAQFYARRDFNPNSGREIAQVVQELGGRLTATTPTGAIQTDKAALLRVCRVESPDELPQDHGLGDFVRSLLQYKAAVKLLSTYCPALHRQDAAGRVHTNFNQMVTDTNRFSSSGPNLQNIPARAGHEFRRCFVARPGHVIVKADFSQLELRIYTHYTREAVLWEAYGGQEEKDVHGLFAQQWGVDRKTAKNGVFGLVYGVEAKKLAATLGIPQEQTRRFVEQMRTTMPSIAGGWREHIGHLLDQFGYVETLYGWRGYYPDYRNPIGRIQKEALRQAANLPIQGTAGGILKRLLRAYDGWRRANGAYDSLPILMVHDEVVFEVPSRYAGEFGRALTGLAPFINPLDVRLVLNVEVGNDWGDTIPIEGWRHATGY